MHSCKWPAFGLLLDSRILLLPFSAMKRHAFRWGWFSPTGSDRLGVGGTIFPPGMKAALFFYSFCGKAARTSARADMRLTALWCLGGLWEHSCEVEQW